MTKKAKKDDRHLIGQKTREGYIVKDGKFYISLSMASRMKNVMAQALALKRLAEETNTFVAARYTELEKEGQRFWTDICDDLGIEIEGHRWMFDPYKDCVFEALPPEKKQE